MPKKIFTMEEAQRICQVMFGRGMRRAEKLLSNGDSPHEYAHFSSEDMAEGYHSLDDTSRNSREFLEILGSLFNQKQQ